VQPANANARSGAFLCRGGRLTESAPLAVEYRPVAELVPYARNARTHSVDQVAQIAASIREFGFLNPVLVDGANGIIAGHGRVLAARQLGMLEIPCIELEHLSDAQRRAYILADNKLALNAGWDQELLQIELADLGGLGVDLGLLGFAADELAAFSPRETPATSPAEFTEYGEEIVTDYRCPSCGYEWSGKPRG